VCEAIFREPREPGIADELAARAIFHLDRILRESLVFGDVEQARAELTSWAGRFANAELGRRLTNLPPNRIHLAGDRELDLLVIGDDARSYAIRFVAFRSRSERLALARRTRAVSPDVAGLLVFALEAGALRRYRLANTVAGTVPRAAQARRLAAPV
jgi:hypothetical protein